MILIGVVDDGTDIPRAVGPRLLLHFPPDIQ